ncbi:condensation domain-containing protein [Desmonostoc muscorum LEGE 12446]|uniref:Phthiocerol/phthiodiolone dimycocerosyl transferase n=1 Tax=Desmonostoc muscorum LEGE 12446 TaxID=1828758 RepID=A0A8J6ZTZ0_DESMC|nr:condensation domain-containing protein [Desmonostoc muscorum]MCF2148297.1 condensation domain-containing protein [Desmonostoc muscorum LEGE 12446]
MERYLGAFEHLFWLYNQFYPMDFATVAKLQGQFSVDQLSMVLRQIQQRHPLLRVCIATDAIGQPKFVETDDEIPLRLVERTDDQHWQAELEVELACSLDWQVAPLLRVVLLQSEAESELMIICHHVIADGLSGVYLMRDILQRLGGEIFERSHLSAALSLESSLFGITPCPETTPKPTDYIPPLSRRAPPHIHTVVLSPELTQQLIQRSRAEHTTVHGAVSAAFLLALTQQDAKPSDVMQCLHPVNVRSHLSLPMPDGVGLYFCLCMTTHSLQPDSAFWDVARSVKSQLSQIDIAQQLVEEHQLRQRAIANLTDATTFAEAGGSSQSPCQLNVTNLGRINMAQQYGNIWIEALHAPAVMPSVVGRNVGVATLGDRLTLTLSSTPLIDVDRVQSERAATAFLSEGVKRLELAVVQEATSEAAWRT